MEEQTISTQCYNILKDIPEENWGTMVFFNGREKCCVRGHIIRVSCNNREYNNRINILGGAANAKIWDAKEIGELCSLDMEMLTLSYRFLNKEVVDHSNIASVNNTGSMKYPQEHPKERVIALLKDMIKEGY